MKRPFSIISRLALLSVLVVLAALPARAQPTSEPAVALMLSPQGVLNNSLERGEPLPVSVRLTSSADPRQPIELVPSSGTWVDLVRVELVDLGTGDVLARAQPMGAPDTARATLSRRQPASGVWLFSSADLAPVKGDGVIVRARLTIPGQPATSGTVASDNWSLSLVSPSAEPDRVSSRTRLRAQIALTQNQLPDAARLLDEALRQLPNDPDLLTLRADVALRAGNTAAAMLLVGRVGRLAPKAAANRQPPLLLEDVRNRILARSTVAAPAAEPPAWSWPPESVLAPVPGASRPAGIPNR